MTQTLLLFALASLHYAAASPEPLHAFLGTTPTLDGVLAPGEWADATVFGDIATWNAQFQPVVPSSPVDLNITAYVKHDGARLFFALQITDNLLYALDTPPFLPPGNPLANNLTQAGWPWFGDEIEILINAPNTYATLADMPTGTPGCWQLVVNSRKSRLGGVGVGGLLEGEPRSSATAWTNYGEWIYSRAAQAGVTVEPAGARGAGGSWTTEVAFDFNPLIEVAPGAYWNVSWPATTVGLNIALGDTDLETNGDPTFGLRHEMWWAGNTTCAGGVNCHTLLYQLGQLVLEPGARA